jgi:hypothetical protein
MPKPLAGATDVSQPSAERLDHWLSQHQLGPLDFIRMMLEGNAPVVADIGGHLLVFREETKYWRAAAVARAKLAQSRIATRDAQPNPDPT